MTVSHSLIFMILTVLKNTGQIFCRMSLNLGLFDAFFYDETGVMGVGKNEEQS